MGARHIIRTILPALLMMGALAACGAAGRGEGDGSASKIFADGVGSNMGAFTQETYTGTVTDRFSEGGGSDTADVLEVELEDGTVLHFTFLETTELTGAEKVSVGDRVEIDSGSYERASGFHPIFSIAVLP